jgi:hypothetical protein
MSCGNPVHRKHSRHFVVAATVRICFSIEARISLGSRSACSSVFQLATVRSAVSTAICQSGLAGILAVSAKLRIWSGVAFAEFVEVLHRCCGIFRDILPFHGEIENALQAFQVTIALTAA